MSSGRSASKNGPLNKTFFKSDTKSDYNQEFVSDYNYPNHSFTKGVTLYNPRGVSATPSIYKIPTQRSVRTAGTPAEASLSF